MKKLLSLILCLSAAVSVLADDIQAPRIAVYGTATTEVVPDQMIWSVRVLNKGPSLETIAGEHSRIVGQVLSLLKEAKVDEKTIQTSRMEFGENWEYRSQSRVKEGYFASTYVSFKIADFGLYRKLWLGLAQMPAASVENVTYSHSKEIEYRNETRQKALLAARDKAISMARTLGSEIGEPLLVEEEIVSYDARSNSVVNNLRMIDAASRDQGDEGALSPGTIPIQARVKVAFRLVTPQK